MEKDIIIEITGMQDYEGQDPDNVELVTSGKFAEKSDGIYITYEESELTGMDSTTTTLKIEPERVTIMRFGQTRSHMIFEIGQKHLSHYDTPFGSFTIGICTHSVDKKITATGGKIEIHYSMEINNALAGENSFSLKFRNASN